MYRKDLYLLFFVLVFFFIIFPILFVYGFASMVLGSKEGIISNNSQGVVLVDRNNTPFFSFYNGNIREYAPLSRIPVFMQHAVISAEDKEFYSHPGFSIKGIVRSIFLNFKEGGVSYGGSTITQQLIKTSVLSPERSFVRKYEEILLANELERRYKKNEILEMYLNSVYFGRGAIGITDAAKVYFGKEPQDLTLSESTFLASLLPSPSALSKDNDNARREYVLNRMVEDGYLSDLERKQSLGTKISFSGGQPVINNVAPHFALYVLEELKKKYGGEEKLKTAGITVKTTLDLPLQEYTQNQVAEQVRRLARNNVSNGAAVVMDARTSEILAMVGSRDWFDETNGKINMAIRPRQPGSSFKPIIYSAALEKGLITPGTILSDRERTFQNGTYKPRDYDLRTRGNVLPRRALANSLNIPAVEVMDKVGVAEALSYAKRFGITTLGEESNYGLSLVLGAGEVPLVEMTDVYAMFANGGKKNPPTAISAIQEKSGKESYSYEAKNEKVLDERVAFQISSILSDKKARSEVFGTALDTAYNAAVKTGTTEDYRDAWTLGYTPEVVVGVWIGNNSNQKMDRIAGSLGAAPIWKNVITYYMRGRSNSAFIEPPGLVDLSICSFNGLVSKVATTSAIREYFLEGTQPTRTCYEGRDTTVVTDDITHAPTPSDVQVTIVQQEFQESPTATPTPFEKKDSVVIEVNPQNNTTPTPIVIP